MHPQLIRLNAHPTRLSIAALWASSILFIPQPKYMEIEDLDLDLVFGTLPLNHTCPPHLVLDGFRLQLKDAVHRLHNLQGLTLFTPRLHSDARENDAWLVPMWDALSAAGIFPPHIVANDLNDGLLGYLEQHLGLDKLALHTMRDSRRLSLHTVDQNTFVGDFLNAVLPRHVHALRHLCIELMDPHGKYSAGTRSRSARF
ncbi:hypothetical protein BD779DRAFT_1800988 [Infundibulicybe gibba]|nr:hypothetical protein BD779DRAFT_1800988 [Infundibulicybe gibba]